MLLTLILIPLIGSITIPLINSIIQGNQGKTGTPDNLCGMIAAGFSILTMIWTLIIWIVSAPAPVSGYVKIERWTYLINLGMDGLTYTFVVLTCLVVTIAILSGTSSTNKSPSSLFYSTLLLLMTLVLGVFLSIDLIMFYICFESSLIPMYLLIGIYGGRSRKKHAANILFLMTLAGSLSTLLAFLVIISEIGYRDLITTSNLIISENRQLLLWLALFISFGLKTPLIPFHVWLPEAHTEANVSGSIILAGILLKLASYGFIRFSIGLLEMGSFYFTPLIYGLSTISILYSSISTLRQIDLKKIIAYSSIGHMSIVNLGIFSNNIMGMEGGIYLMIAHGLVSPALFILVTVLYDRFHTRIIKYYRGMVNIMPVYAIYLLLFTLANMAIPFTGNFIGELLSLTGTMSKNPLITLLAALGIILAGGYSIWFQNRILYGKLTKHIKNIWAMAGSKDLSRFEFHILLPLLALTILTGLNTDLIIYPIHYSVSYLI